VQRELDRVFVVTSADGDFNLRRLERYLVAIAAGGAEAQIVLTKADLAEELEVLLAEAGTLGEAFATSAKTGAGIDSLRARMAGRTTALVGSSGVGKSALVNAVLGQATQLEGAVREWDGRGRHTTTRRSLFAVPGGGFLIDTPGMRELTPWLPETSLDDAFDDVLTLARACRYRDCSHEAEPGCAVREAVTRGALAPDRLAAFEKLRAERRTAAPRQEEARRRMRSATIALRKRVKEKR